MLLIVDAQVNQFEPPMAVHDGPVILDRLKRLVARARAANVPIAFIQNDGGEADPDLPGTPGWALHPELLPTGSEKVYRKTTTDSFHETGLLEDLRAAGAAEVVPEVIEGSLMLASQTLAHIGIPLKRVIRLVQRQRMTRYALMRDVLKHKEGLGDVEPH